MHAKHPDIAKAWDKGKSSVTGKKEGMHKKRKKRTVPRKDANGYY